MERRTVVIWIFSLLSFFMILFCLTSWFAIDQYKFPVENASEESRTKIRQLWFTVIVMLFMVGAGYLLCLVSITPIGYGVILGYTFVLANQMLLSAIEWGGHLNGSHSAESLLVTFGALSFIGLCCLIFTLLIFKDDVIDIFPITNRSVSFIKEPDIYPSYSQWEKESTKHNIFGQRTTASA